MAPDRGGGRPAAGTLSLEVVMVGARLVKIGWGLGIAVCGAVILTVTGCIRSSGGAWYFKEAPLPEGWPELTPVDEVEIRAYPTYRAAVVDDGERMDPMFRSLFQHISTNDIPMTAPVDMTYEPSADGGDDRMTGMAFLYRTRDLGPLGVDGVVRVEDVPPQAYASTGVRGGYTQENFDVGLARVRAWLASQTAWRSDGSPRFLGYNSPFVPWFWRYGEVQVPVVPSVPSSTSPSSG